MPTQLTADQILAITDPSILFPEGEKSWKELLKIWHPDVQGGNDAIAKHINIIYQKQLQIVEFVDSTKHRHAIKYRFAKHFELGTMYYGLSVMCFVVDPKFAKQFDLGVNQIKTFTYPDTAVRDEMVKYFPYYEAAFKDRMSGNLILITTKAPDTFLLSDILLSPKFDGKLDPKHVAWVISGLLNIACYLEWARVSHNSINIDTVWLSPRLHSVMLLGGWWHCLPFGKRYIQLPRHSFQYLGLGDEMASPKLDLTMIKVLGRKLLGDESGMSLTKSPLVTFLNSSLTKMSAKEIYHQWQKQILPETFGQRKFVPMEFSVNDIKIS